MDNRPIGILDSGLGGLTSVWELHRKLPQERVIYYGDTARTPYGSKSPETIVKFASQLVERLISCDVKMIIIACNTITAWGLTALREKFPGVPIIGVIGPTVRKVVGDGVDRVGVIATKGTISSDMYGVSLRELNPEIKVYSRACPAIVPLIEEGLDGTDIMELTIKHYMDDFVGAGEFDDLILGCTHYPIVAGQLKKLYPNIRLYSSSAEVVEQAREILERKDMLASGSDYTDGYYASDLSENFINLTEKLFEGEDFKVHLLKLEE